jgi:hypothetical protein
LCIVCVGTDVWSCMALGTSLLIVIRPSINMKPVRAILCVCVRACVCALTACCLFYNWNVWARINTFCRLYAHSLVCCTCNTFTYVKTILFGLLNSCTDYLLLHFLAVTTEVYLLWVWISVCCLLSPNLYRIVLSVFKTTEYDMPELESICRSVFVSLCANTELWPLCFAKCVWADIHNLSELSLGVHGLNFVLGLKAVET